METVSGCAAVIEELNQPLTVHEVPDPACPADGAIVPVPANGICRTAFRSP